MPAWVAKELEILAKISGMPRATFAASIITSYINSSLRPDVREVRDKALNIIAAMEGVTVEQLTQGWLDEDS